MKKLLTLLCVPLIVMLCGFALVACTDQDDPFASATEANLVEKYGLQFEANIWNDYMPSDTPKNSQSIGYVAIGYPNDNMLVHPNLQEISMSVKIITNNKTVERTFSYFEGMPSIGIMTWAKYRATNDFRLNDGEDFTMDVTILIDSEKQTITLTGTVFTTH